MVYENPCGGFIAKRPNWFMRFMRGVWQIIEGLLGMDPPRS